MIFSTVQWKVELLDAQMHGLSMRLLVRPQRTEQPAADRLTAGGALEIYLSRWHWRGIAVEPGQLLLLEIGPEAIYWFDFSIKSR